MPSKEEKDNGSVRRTVNTYRIIIVLCVFLTAVGTWILMDGSKPETPKETTIILEYDGCRVYRFNDNGVWVYFARCKDSSSVTTKYSVPSGKGSSSATTDTIQER